MPGTDQRQGQHDHQVSPHPVTELGSDLALEQEALRRSIEHDYSTSDNGIVPLDRRRPRWHLATLWTTLVSGFLYLFLGFELHDGGHGLGGTVGIAILAAAIYMSYATVGAYLGARTGQTHALLSRSIFGRGGSIVVSGFVFLAALGWVGYLAGLCVQIWVGLYGWGSIELVTIILAVAMVTNNVFGFTGISVFARYVFTPVLCLWVMYLIGKGIITDSGQLGHIPKPAAGTVVASFWPALGAAIAFATYGNEPDIFRYGRPRFLWAVPAFGFAYIWNILFIAAGWMMAELSHAADFGAQMNFIAHYSLFGAIGLLFVVATVSQIAINDGNYYESINAGQNLLGSWRRWRRLYTCLLTAALAGISAYVVNFQFLNGWFKVAGFLAITVPSATVIMSVDHFVLPRLFGISRPLTQVPSWREAGAINAPATLALVITVLYGAWASALFPAGLEDQTRYWGPVPIECWLMAGGLYVAFVACARVVRPRLTGTLAFSRHALEMPVTAGAIVDITSQAQAAPAGSFANEPAAGAPVRV